MKKTPQLKSKLHKYKLQNNFELLNWRNQSVKIPVTISLIHQARLIVIVLIAANVTLKLLNLVEISKFRSTNLKNCLITFTTPILTLNLMVESRKFSTNQRSWTRIDKWNIRRLFLMTAGGRLQTNLKDRFRRYKIVLGS